MRKNICLCAWLCAACALPAQAQLQKTYYAQKGVEIRGVVPTENITSLEINPAFTAQDNSHNVTLNQLTVKVSNAFNAHWNAGIEVPLSRYGAEDYSKRGLGDVLLSGSYVAALADKRFSYGVTSDLILPTATGEDLGAGKVQLAPAVYGVYHPTPNFFISLGYRQWFSVAGDGGRENINHGRIRNAWAYLSDSQWWALLDLRYLINYQQWGEAAFAPQVEIGSMINSGVSAYIRTGGRLAGNMNQADWTVSIGLKLLHI